MTTPTLSRIVPADKAAVGVVEKWRTPDWNKSSDSVNSLVPESQQQTTNINDSAASIKADASKNEVEVDEDSGNGFAGGFAEGMQAAEAEMKAQLDSIYSMVGMLAAPVRCVTDEVTAELLDLAVDMARSILKHELQSTPELLRSFIDDAVARLPAQSSPTQVAVNPDDFARLQSFNDVAATQSKNDTPNLSDIDWVTDASLAAGQFVVSRDSSRVHGGIDEMLKRVCAGALK